MTALAMPGQPGRGWERAALIALALVLLAGLLMLGCAQKTAHVGLPAGEPTVVTPTRATPEPTVEPTPTPSAKLHIRFSPPDRMYPGPVKVIAEITGLINWCPERVEFIFSPRSMHGYDVSCEHRGPWFETRDFPYGRHRVCVRVYDAGYPYETCRTLQIGPVVSPMDGGH
jgi:hypothetical protein